MMSGRNRFPFTASQWQELEHQALIFKYMISGMPIPPDLLFSIKRSIDSPLSSNLFPHQPQHIGWNCFQMGLGRKVDPEPGRCRRTDGKKWRCSKEAFPDSKYCERHMHRGKNRSRKPVEVMTTATTTTNPSITPILSITKNPSTDPSNLTSRSLSSLSSITSETHHHHHHRDDHPCYNTHLQHPFYYPHSSSSRPPGIGLSSQDNTTHLHLDSGSYSQTEPDYRYIHGLKEEVDEHAFFSETSGSMRNFSGSSMDDSCQLTPLTMSSSLAHSKQRSCSGLQSGYSYLQLQSLTDTSKQLKQDQHCYVLGSDIKCEMPLKIERGDEPQKTVHRFFDEWPKNRDSWLNLDDKSSNCPSVSTTQLSISIPTSSLDFPIFNSRSHTGD